MKRVFFLLLFVTICVMAHAEWIGVAESNDYIVSINDDITKDDRYYLVWVKYEAKSSALTKERREFYKDFKKKGFLKYTHFLVLQKFDLNGKRLKNITTVYYASDKVIESFNFEYESQWEYPVPGSLYESTMNAVKTLVNF